MADMKDLPVLSAEDRAKLKQQPSTRYPTGKRNAAIIAVLGFGTRSGGIEKVHRIHGGKLT